MNLSFHFSLKEFINSETATKYGYSEQWNPSEEVKNNLIDLAVNTAEPIRKGLDLAFSPTCGFRCKRVNDKVGGASDSEHLYGNAFDETFIRNGKNVSREVFDWIIAGGLSKWSKLILEFPDKNGIPRWLHIGYDKNNLSKQVLVAQKDIFGRTEYKDFFKSKWYKK